MSSAEPMCLRFRHQWVARGLTDVLRSEAELCPARSTVVLCSTCWRCQRDLGMRSHDRRLTSLSVSSRKEPVPEEPPRLIRRAGAATFFSSSFRPDQPRHQLSPALAHLADEFRSLAVDSASQPSRTMARAPASVLRTCLVLRLPRELEPGGVVPVVGLSRRRPALGRVRYDEQKVVPPRIERVGDFHEGHGVGAGYGHLAGPPRTP